MSSSLHDIFTYECKSVSDNTERSVFVFSVERIELCIVDRMQGKVRTVRTIAQKIRERWVRRARMNDRWQLPGVMVRYGGGAL